MKYFLPLILILCHAALYPQAKTSHKCVKVARTFALDPKISEASGLASWNGRLWTHNDSGESRLFALDTSTGQLTDEYKLPRIINNDWEDITQDSLYFYLGDIGNNAGDRDVLQIIRIEKASLLQNKPAIDSITFSWPEMEKTDRKGKPLPQSKQGKEKVNFDCEAMVVRQDSIYLFTKEWQKKRITRVFSIPKVPGKYIPKYKSTLPTRVLVTGATFNRNGKQLVLCGYNLWLRPFLLVFPDVNGTDFFCGRFIKYRVRLPFRQVEGVESFDGKNYYLINEDFKYLFLHTKRGLHLVRI